MKPLIKRLVSAVALVVVVLIVAVAVILYPKFSNMASEYATANAIHRVEEYVKAHDGQWPASDEELYGAPVSGGDVYIDYTVKSSELIADPGRLRKAIRPRSGKFYTYPHYDEKLASLFSALQESEHRTRR